MINYILRKVYSVFYFKGKILVKFENLYAKQRNKLDRLLKELDEYPLSENFSSTIYKNKLYELKKELAKSQDILNFWDLAMEPEAKNKKYLVSLLNKVS